jgi:hypothetical protein
MPTDPDGFETVRTRGRAKRDPPTTRSTRGTLEQVLRPSEETKPSLAERRAYAATRWTPEERLAHQERQRAAASSKTQQATAPAAPVNSAKAARLSDRLTRIEPQQPSDSLAELVSELANVAAKVQSLAVRIGRFTKSASPRRPAAALVSPNNVVAPPAVVAESKPPQLQLSPECPMQAAATLYQTKGVAVLPSELKAVYTAAAEYARMSATHVVDATKQGGLWSYADLADNVAASAGINYTACQAWAWHADQRYAELLAVASTADGPAEQTRDVWQASAAEPSKGGQNQADPMEFVAKYLAPKSLTVIPFDEIQRHYGAAEECARAVAAGSTDASISEALTMYIAQAGAVVAAAGRGDRVDCVRYARSVNHYYGEMFASLTAAE